MVLSVETKTVRTWWEMERDDFMRTRFTFQVRGGDWDVETKAFTEHFVSDSIHSRFVRGVPWSDTRIAEVAFEGIRSGDGRCRTAGDLEERLTGIERLYEHVARNGYKAQVELVASNDHPLRRHRPRPPELDEIIVGIGRDGDFILIDGIHRFSVASALDVPSIPVCVLVRHADWQARRDRIARDPSSASPLEAAHPDMAVRLPRTHEGRVVS
ncbi:MAG: hypothetical protein H0X64_11570 [Gemmatimonadaceae bacterium]|nr:hypothetical protein [Gemmatimonadaceae bacterium]